MQRHNLPREKPNKHETASLEDTAAWTEIVSIWLTTATLRLAVASAIKDLVVLEVVYHVVVG